MKKVAIIQSSYIPWKGYFDIIHDVDLFIFYDDRQYTVRDWRNRNKIKTPNGTSWLTIPVGSDRNRLIYEVEIVDDSWQKNHWETMKQYYSKASYFKEYKDFFEHVYLEMKWGNLSELNQYLVKWISKNFLGIKTEFKDSREYNAQGYRLDRILDLLDRANATFYLSGPSAKDYIVEERFMEKGIQLQYKDYSGYPEYQQFFPPYEHAVTILDVLFNCGPDASHYIWGWREKV